YTREELLKLTPLDIISPKDHDLLPSIIRKLRKGKSSLFESIHITKDGREIPVNINPNMFEFHGEITVLCVARDITERKQAEKGKQQLEAQLQRAQKMEAIGTLAGGVAHDLNNILSGIVSYPELLLMDMPEDSHLRKPILTIQKSGQKAAAIVQDLLTLARRGVVVTEVLNFNQIIDAYLNSPEYEKLKEFYPDVKIKSNLETHLLSIMGSSVHLSKTIMNLVSNAAEAMPDGGNVLISTQSKYIDKPIRGYDYVEEGDYVVLTVSDTGVGIPSEDTERIFEPFYTKKKMGRSGTGLGMAVVWGTVKDHKGYIDVQGAEGKGTTFTLYFPVTRKEISGKEKTLLIEEYMGNGESILVVDDVEGQREIASLILKRLGYSVTSVSSGEEALDYLRNNSADLLVLDMIMDPGIDGLETYKRILELYPGQKAIIASGFSETDRVKEAQRLGAGQYIKKPYTLEK
ncbi:MAG: response regulator, partial [Proteobacteria bacterium]|nr:response regulator [Pseudomonadota bacterium]